MSPYLVTLLIHLGLLALGIFTVGLVVYLWYRQARHEEDNLIVETIGTIATARHLAKKHEDVRSYVHLIRARAARSNESFLYHIGTDEDELERLCVAHLPRPKGSLTIEPHPWPRPEASAIGATIDDNKAK